MHPLMIRHDFSLSLEGMAVWLTVAEKTSGEPIEEPAPPFNLTCGCLQIHLLSFLTTLKSKTRCLSLFVYYILLLFVTFSFTCCLILKLCKTSFQKVSKPIALNPLQSFI